MFCRRSLFSRVRDATLGLAMPSVASVFRAADASAGAHNAIPVMPNGFQSMPFDNLPYGAPPLIFGERHGVTVILTTDMPLVRSLVPAPLKPLGAELIIQQHMNTITEPLRVRYPNAMVIVPASFDGAAGLYIARVYEGSSEATLLTIWGREIWGFPKVAADTDVSRDGDQTASYVRARNASADVVLRLRDSTRVEPKATVAQYCRKTIPSADNRGPDLDRIIEIPWRHTAEHRVLGEVTRCDIKLDMRGKAVQLPVKEFGEALWFTQAAGSILDKGKVVHDYLR